MRRIEPLVVRLPDDEAFKRTPLFAHMSLAGHERQQLGFLLRLFAPSLTDAADSGFAFRAGTTDVVGGIVKCVFDPRSEDGAEVGEQLARAQARYGDDAALDRWLRSELASVRFSC
jgi:hypothetical protein